MRPNEHDLNSLRKIIRKLQDENASLKEILDKNGIAYDSANIIDSVDISDDYDEDQGGRIFSVVS
ncbi:MAG: hypothetical protein J5923_07875 [Acidaminococcaceae bacterium]|nr:hypothetical protein [Acidaminococcaceae bacterium]MBR1494017.1 hypothetical protein [Acidaminococcaceae bacterium]